MPDAAATRRASLFAPRPNLTLGLGFVVDAAAVVATFGRLKNEK